MTKWISVEDRLPSEEEFVLVYDGFMNVACYTGTGWVYERLGTVRGVTHWKPLPEEPK